MPTPPLSDELALEAVEVWRRNRRSRTKAAQELGIASSTFEHRLRVAQERGLDQDPAIRDSMAAVGTGLVPRLAWAKTKSEDGTSYSVLLKPDQDAPESLIEKVRTAFDGLEAALPVPAPTYADADLVTIYPIADAHIGMQAWGRETGEDYDTHIAINRLQNWIARCVASSPASGHAVIMDVGDTTHADSQTNQTPKSKHILDVDSRYFRTLDVTIAALARATETALQRHAHVTVVILPGNHSPHSYMAIMFALAERYRNEPRVTVHKEPGEFWVHEFGDLMIAAHHGDKAPPQRLVMFMADEYAAIWGRTKHRFLFTGHLHHAKMQDIGGMQHEQLRAMTARDAYAVSNAYTARAQLQGITLHRKEGEVQRVKVNA